MGRGRDSCRVARAVLLDESEPGAKPLDLVPRRGDSLAEQLVFSLQETHPLPGLMEIRRHMSLALPRPELLLRLLGPHPPGFKLLLKGRQQALQLQERGSIRPCVG